MVRHVTVRVKENRGSRLERGTYEGGDEQPAGVSGDPSLPAAELGGHLHGIRQGGDHEAPEERDGQAGGDPLRSRRGQEGRGFVSSRRARARRGREFSRGAEIIPCLLYTSPSPRDGLLSRMPSSA